MAPVTEAQLEQIRSRIGALSTDSIHVSGVKVDDAERPDGPVVLVAVTLTSSGSSPEWDPEDFLTLRRNARTVALDALDGQDVRLVYESGAAPEASDSEAESVPTEGEKVVRDGDF